MALPPLLPMRAPMMLPMVLPPRTGTDGRRRSAAPPRRSCATCWRAWRCNGGEEWLRQSMRERRRCCVGDGSPMRKRGGELRHRPRTRSVCGVVRAAPNPTQYPDADAWPTDGALPRRAARGMRRDAAMAGDLRRASKILKN
eukprot:354463-Chlamydomonas_euryale.AAC.5